jgi:hypothetical protein
MTCGTKEGEIYLYTPLKSIRRKCQDCCCGSAKEVSLCPVKDCSLHFYRFGKNPRRKGKGGFAGPKKPHTNDDFSPNS